MVGTSLRRAKAIAQDSHQAHVFLEDLEQGGDMQDILVMPFGLPCLEKR